MGNDFENLPIGAFAKAAEVNVETIRFYQRKALLRAPARPLDGIRRYGTADVARVNFIKAAQRLGFSLDEIAGLLKLEDGAHCDDARAFAEHKLREVRDRLHDLRRIESALTGLVRACSDARGTISCPLIGSLKRPRQRS